MKNNKLTSAIKMALMFSAATSITMAANAAENGNDSIERIEVTGSGIKRADMENAAPITSFSKADIAATGVMSVPDLIKQIPSMQGFTVGADSVGGSGGGQQTASLRGIGSAYTLVLLNGKRMAPSGSGSTIDLSSIPLSAVERVDVLTEGASAIYGSDAIAGVINFILKKDLDTTTLSVRADKPQDNGGESSNFSITTGYGSLDGDGFNILASYSRDSQEQLLATDREFSKTGIIPFTYEGNDLIWQRTSSNAIPANAYVKFNKLDKRSFNPYKEINGSCAPSNIPSGTTCAYDFAETVEMMPESTRDNIFLQGLYALGDTAELYSTATWSRFSMITRIAPKPSGAFTIPIDTPLVQDSILPHLSDAEKADLKRVDIAYRFIPAGKRTAEWETDTTHLVFGVRGDYDDISYDASITHGTTERSQIYLTGRPFKNALNDLLATGTVDVFAPADQLSDESNKAIQATNYNGLWYTTDTEMTAIQASASMPVYELPAGDIYIGTGLDYRMSGYSRDTSHVNKQSGVKGSDLALFSEAASPEYDLERDTYGAYIETIIPVIDGLEVTAALRYDNIGEATDGKLTGNQIVGKESSDTTYKISVAYRPIEDLLLRGSIGTGFKAPSMLQIAQPRVPFGVTSSSYECPVPASDSRAQYCHEGSLQYDVFNEGNPELSPETSEQASVGFVYSPSVNFSMNIDWWRVDISDQVKRPSQDQIFKDPTTYAQLYTTRIQPGTGDEVLAIIQGPVNVGESNSEGIDYAIDVMSEFGEGFTLKSKLSGTYMIESEQLKVGTKNVYNTSLGQYGPDQEVVFRNQISINNTISHGDFSHALNFNYKSGYRDQAFKANSTRIRLASDFNKRYDGEVQLDVADYMTVNYSTKYHFNDELTLQFGINNLFDKEPPRSLRTGGTGHITGYDPRYTDNLLRTFYFSADYTF